MPQAAKPQGGIGFLPSCRVPFKLQGNCVGPTLLAPARVDDSSKQFNNCCVSTPSKPLFLLDGAHFPKLLGFPKFVVKAVPHLARGLLGPERLEIPREAPNSRALQYGLNAICLLF